jgi:hypothetical protein
LNGITMGIIAMLSACSHNVGSLLAAFDGFYWSGGQRKDRFLGVGSSGPISTEFQR